MSVSKPLGNPASASSFLRLLGIVRKVLDLVVVRPHGRRDQVLRRLTGTLIHRLQDRLLVDRHVDGDAHALVGERRLLVVERQIADVQSRLLHQLQRRIRLDRRQVGQIGKRHDLALVGAQLGKPHRGVLVDREHQRVELRLRPPVAGEGAVADGGIALILHQLERPGADRLLVDQLGLALLQQRIGVFLRLDRGEVHRQVGQERRLRLGQREPHRVGVHHVDRRQQLVEAHVVEVVVAAAGHLVIRIGVLPLPLEREHHVVGVEVAARLEGLVGLPLDAMAQVEGEALAVRPIPPSGRRAPA